MFRNIVLHTLILFNIVILPHPAGDMIYINNTLLWSYIYPIGNIQHNASVMMWDRENGVRPWLISEYSASDWMISVADSEHVYLIENYYNNNDDSHYARLLKSKVGSDPIEIVPWFKDNYRIAQHGFIFREDSTILFVNYPDLYKYYLDGTIENVDNWNESLGSVRKLTNGNYLLRSDSSAWLTDNNLNILNSWNELLEPLGNNLPFGGNQIFDVDYVNESLYMAYWGKRSFDIIKNQKRDVLLSFNSPWVPHHIAAGDSKIFMLSSTLAPDVTSNIEPSLWLIEDDKFELIWGDSGIVTEAQVPLGMNQLGLFQNYPNPFNPTTKISYSISEQSYVKLDVFDLSGRKIATLVDMEQPMGNYDFKFDPKAYGIVFASGIYFYRLKVRNISKRQVFVETKKMLLLK